MIYLDPPPDNSPMRFLEYLGSTQLGRVMGRSKQLFNRHVRHYRDGGPLIKNSSRKFSAKRAIEMEVLSNNLPPQLRVKAEDFRPDLDWKRDDKGAIVSWAKKRKR